MPQMSPMNWILLFYLFIILYLYSIIMNFYLFSYFPKLNTSNKLKIKKTWKW